MSDFSPNTAITDRFAYDAFRVGKIVYPFRQMYPQYNDIASRMKKRTAATEAEEVIVSRTTNAAIAAYTDNLPTGSNSAKVAIFFKTQLITSTGFGYNQGQVNQHDNDKLASFKVKDHEIQVAARSFFQSHVELVYTGGTGATKIPSVNEALDDGSTFRYLGLNSVDRQLYVDSSGVGRIGLGSLI